MMSEPVPPMRTKSGWFNKMEFSLLPANNTEELLISCSATNSAGQLTETTRLQVTGEFTCFISLVHCSAVWRSFPRSC